MTKDAEVDCKRDTTRKSRGKECQEAKEKNDSTRRSDEGTDGFIKERKTSEVVGKEGKEKEREVSSSPPGRGVSGRPQDSEPDQGGSQSGVLIIAPHVKHRQGLDSTPWRMILPSFQNISSFSSSSLIPEYTSTFGGYLTAMNYGSSDYTTYARSCSCCSRRQCPHPIGRQDSQSPYSQQVVMSIVQLV